MPPIKKIVRKSAKLAAKSAIQVLPQLPGRPGRLTGKLAKEGGLPVRDTRYRPWPVYPSSSLVDWTTKLAPRFLQIFLTGVEGLPQPLATRFATEWANYCGARYGLVLPHGTDALRVAIAAAIDHDGIEYGGEIIVPNLSFIASATTVLDRGFGIALVDVDPETYLLDPKRVEEAIIPGKTRALMAVHLFGQTADMTALRDIAKRHSLVLLEDAAQAHGAIHELGRAGSIGDAAGFSFQSSKNLSGGEGGAFTTN
ncbi:MAG TPA: DegT/DnrJ/EryC1/StrS family aminotransferase, partial [Pyrinomonadaceae bacterium]|nr:DegT/DnrJ/EryC1/StrS family aminotransferase [Pyrinomonadaceae bacterium]